MSGPAQSQAPTGLAPGVTLTPDDTSRQLSPTATIAAEEEKAKGMGSPQPSTESTLGEITSKKVSTALSGLPAARKSILLLCFCLAMFMLVQYATIGVG